MHDILLRFIGIDPLTAAGDGSRIPSRLSGSGESNAVLGKVSPDGDTLPAVKSQQKQQAAAAASSAAAAVDKEGQEGQPIDKERELRYGPRRTAVLFSIIVCVTLAIYGLLRWRVRQRRRKGWMPEHQERKRQTPVRPSSQYRLSKLSQQQSPRRQRDTSETTLLQQIEAHERGENTADRSDEIDDDSRALFASVDSPRRH